MKTRTAIIAVVVGIHFLTSLALLAILKLTAFTLFTLFVTSYVPVLLPFSVALLLYVPTLGFALDSWRLRHPSAPSWTVSFFATIAALMVFPMMILCIVPFK